MWLLTPQFSLVMHSSPTISSCGFSRADSNCLYDAGHQVGPVPLSKIDGLGAHLELMWLNSGILMGRAPLPTLASKREGCRLRAWQHLPSRGKKLPVNGADRRKQLRGRRASPSDLKGLKHAGNQLYHRTLQLTERLGGGHPGGITAVWSVSWTQAIRRSSLPPLSSECTFCPLFPQWGCSEGLSLERALCGWDHLDGAHDWTQLRPLYKILRFWWVGANI